MAGVLYHLHLTISELTQSCVTARCSYRGVGTRRIHVESSDIVYEMDCLCGLSPKYNSKIVQSLTVELNSNRNVT